MKIGIITVFDAVNYGSFLQAFCLQEAIKELGHEVKFIKTSSLKYEKWRIKCLFTYNIKKIPYKYKFAKGFFYSWNKLNITRKRNGYDLVIIGSDEMWQVKNLTFKPLKEFFGCNIGANKIITYAICCNDTTTEDTKKFPFIQEGINKISSISVRDKATYDAYKPLTSKEFVYSLDPTFLVDLEKFEIENNRHDYILVYTYGFTEERIRKTVEFAKKKNKRLISVAQKFDWCDESIAASPFEFLGLIKNADYVITDTFHGTILSISYNKEFISFASHKRKVLKTLEQFDLMNRNGETVEELEIIAQNTIDYKKVNENINQGRIESIDYLKKYIK